jgi:hypothetical protein
LKINILSTWSLTGSGREGLWLETWAPAAEGLGWSFRPGAVIGAWQGGNLTASIAASAKV